MSILNRAALLSTLFGVTLSFSAASLANASTVHQPAAFSLPVHAKTKGAKGFVYACMPAQNQCSIYDLAGNRLRVVTNGLSMPAGTMANARDMWYVANVTGGNIVVFPKGGTTPIETLADPGQEPRDVAVSKKLVVVSNEFGDGASSPGSVSVYTKGATNPSYLLSVSGAFQGIGVAIDPKGNCYWSFNAGSSSGGGHIVEFAGCKTKSRGVDIGVTLGSAGGLAFDAGGNLWFTDQTTGLYQCLGITSCTLVASGFSDPLAINFNKDGTTLYLADTRFGIYAITGFDARGRLRAHPDYIVTPFAPAPGTYGVSPGPT